ncbi:MAG: hypothetical protein A3J10_00990 [Candidatus Sungbacteria bacterium RIFCSPLOWO2_02_FULL_54_10]|uniref:Transposase IS200-like domain-containing protein n=2 Tax=Candidatus Sungiibacteriota TaxID=1817917 RepID=A0A1G2L780_9BACT|nr:MAG: hypothetical protein A2679_03430 [Candidatus Sungbacteria bacterium RIFCSPHIGHO2_01_FULL_54_26]OHA03870.1 MAG: hypothetical protein A3C92_02315 [Candidatus Sungbacteria bacterium RIFCSPHIGHO2_02_FULL_53_17]OHA07495.1 MAG: hypothetical protein A3B34_03735 [Candidatus Sungbacteria bacterium RIFCSPLOWO2_01_FULL_54_21]OHA12322.1 MAG: hypothetical protein A3J10_00990 [Candidatus Sungbacteria bacterium RIFCSPLOWO2_02_FULL_54_10]
MRKEVFLKDEYYHIYNRGVDKRVVFFDDRERTRFVNTLYLLNNFQDIPANFDPIMLRPRDVLIPRDPIVEVVAACLMPNHYHLAVRGLSDGAISKFLHKVGVSYTMYFNKRHERSGALFEGSFKARHIDKGEYATYLTKYIHFNPYPLFQTKSGIMLDDLVSYPWSTLNDYVGGESRFSHVVNTDFRDTILGMNAREYGAYCSGAFNDLKQDSFQT